MTLIVGPEIKLKIKLALFVIKSIFIVDDSLYDQQIMDHAKSF